MRRREFLALPFFFALPPLGAPAAAVEYPAVRPRRLHFPRDHGAHPDFRTEWWYVTGWLDGYGEALGFQLTFFRVRIGVGEHNPSRFAPRQLLFAHAAIADPRWGRLRSAERSARADGRFAGYDEADTAVWLGPWSIRRREDAYHAIAVDDDFAFSLMLQSGSPPLLHGEGGFSQKASDPRHASHYYSRPQLAVSGQLTLAGRQTSVTGIAWLDHEWSSELLPESAQGWEWFALNLVDGGALMAFRLREESGRTIWAAATQADAGGMVRGIAHDEIAFTPVAHWRSPRSDILWPIVWAVRLGQRLIRLEPLLADQEFDARRSTGTIYWEGAVKAWLGDRLIGRGYLEMTGRGERIRIGR